MIADNQKISMRQAAWILVLNILAAGIFWLPSGLGGLAFGEMMLAGILALLAVGLYYGGAFRWLNRPPAGKMGRRISTPAGCILIIYYLAALTFGLHYFYRIIDVLIPAEYKYPLTLLLLVIPLIYGAGKGVEVRGRMAELTGWLVCTPLILLMILGFWQAFSQGLPMDGLFEGGAVRTVNGAVISGADSGAAAGSLEGIDASFIGGNMAVLKAGYGVLWPFLLGDHPFLLWRQIHFSKMPEAAEEKSGTKKRPGKKILFWGLAGGGLMVLAALALTGLYLTPAGMAAEKEPFGIVLQLIRFPGNFISRYDVFFIMLWMIAFYIYAGGMLLSMAELSAELIRAKRARQKGGASMNERKDLNRNDGNSKRGFALVYGLLALLLACLARQWDWYDIFFARWMGWVGVPLAVLLIFSGHGRK